MTLTPAELESFNAWVAWLMIGVEVMMVEVRANLTDEKIGKRAAEKRMNDERVIRAEERMDAAWLVLQTTGDAGTFRKLTQEPITRARRGGNTRCVPSSTP